MAQIGTFKKIASVFSFCLALSAIAESPDQRLSRIHAQMRADSHLRQAVEGPNCINTALVAAGLLQRHRYSSNSEILTFLESPLCRRVDQEEELEAGDIGLVIGTSLPGRRSRPARNEPLLVSHAFVHLSGSLNYEKRGSGKTEPYRSVTTDEIVSDYGPSIELRYFRCITVDDFLGERGNTPSNPLAELLDRSDSTEATLEQIVFPRNLLSDGSAASPALLERVERDILEIASDARALKGADRDRTFGRILASRLVSMANQLSFLGRPALQRKTAPWLFESKGIEGAFEALR